VVSLLRRFLPETLNALILLAVAKPRTPILRAYGFAKSLGAEAALDPSEHAMPWIPYCAAKFLDQRLTNDVRVLEYGSGNSTIFFMRRVREVVAVESAADWFTAVNRSLFANARVVQVQTEEADYVTAAGTLNGLYDVVMIDGIHRVACFKHALGLVSPRGVIILDDSEREEYSEAFVVARQHGFRTLSLEGHKAGSAGLHATSFFYRDGNCLGL